MRKRHDSGQQRESALVRLCRNPLRPSIAVLIGLVVLVVGATTAQRQADAQAPAPGKLAFVVGVATYHKDGLRNLDYAEADARELADVLRKGGFKTTLVVGNQATLKTLNAELEKFYAELKQLGKSDVALLSFSGHGLQFGVSRGGRLVEEPFFCPVDCLKTDVKTLLSFNDVMERIKQDSGSSQNLMLIDACRDNPGKGAKGVDGSTVTELPNKLSVLFSSSSGTQSYESEKVKHGIFTHFVLQGLRGDAADRRGQITWLSLASHVMSLVPEETPKLLDDPRMQQRPNLLGNLVRQPVLARLDVRPVPPTLPEPRPGQPFDNSIGMKLAYIPAGEFMMGSTPAQIDKVVKFDPSFKKEYADDEQPQHKVRITRPFYLGVHEVAMGQFARFVQDQNYTTEAERDGKGGYGFNQAEGKFEQKPEYTWRNTGFAQDDSHPVVNVSWNDAAAFVRWLSDKEKREYRLPTEAEWEYACRAGTPALYHHGDDPEGLALVANVADGTAKAKFSNWSGISAKDGYVFTAPVGRLKSNAFGLYDMHGNVWEWCSDWYDSAYYKSSPQADPQGASGGSNRVNRGGSWYDSAGYCRSAGRDGDEPSNRGSNLGFRVALSPSSK